MNRPTLVRESLRSQQIINSTWIIMIMDGVGRCYDTNGYDLLMSVALSKRKSYYKFFGYFYLFVLLASLI